MACAVALLLWALLEAALLLGTAIELEGTALNATQEASLFTCTPSGYGGREGYLLASSGGDGFACAGAPPPPPPPAARRPRTS